MNHGIASQGDHKRNLSLLLQIMLEKTISYASKRSDLRVKAHLRGREMEKLVD